VAKKLFTERHGIVPPRIGEELNADATVALLGLVNARIDENWFGEHFPYQCPDGGHNAGCDTRKLQTSLAGYRVIWPKDWPDHEGQAPTDSQMFDLLEFCFEHIALPKAYGFHSYFSHDHFTYEVDAGREKFAFDVNRIFERQGLTFEMNEGEIRRLAPAGLQDALAETVFSTGDIDLDQLLETAREKFLNRSPEIRKEGLEKLWDAWERLKTIEPGKDKKEQASALLDKASAEPVLRARLETEAMELNFIGNNLMIRHTEVGKPDIVTTAQVDYLFHRMFAMIRLLLKSSARGG
jgi:hypothetical protein